MTTDRYTHDHSDAVLRSHRQRTAENSAGYLLPHLREGMSVLDVGCGPGTITVDLARRVAPGRVVGVDVSADVLTEATAHGSERGAGNVTFVAADFREADLGGAFDVVHAHQVLQHLCDPVGALTAMRALAAPGGVVAARDSDYSSFAWSPDDERMDRWMAVYFEVTRHNGADATAGRRLLGWAQQAGFEDIAYTSSTWTVATPEERSWWGGLWADRTEHTSLAAQAIEYGVATQAELAEIAAGWREWINKPDAVFVSVHGEIVARA